MPGLLPEVLKMLVDIFVRHTAMICKGSVEMCDDSHILRSVLISCSACVLISYSPCVLM